MNIICIYEKKNEFEEFFINYEQISRTIFLIYEQFSINKQLSNFHEQFLK